MAIMRTGWSSWFTHAGAMRWAALAIMFASQPVIAQPMAPGDIGKRAVTTVMEQFANLKALALSAEVTVTLHEPIEGSSIAVGEPIAGMFNYDALGDKWRKSSFLDPAKYPGMNTIVAYDGELYSYTTPGNSSTSVSDAGDDRPTGVVLPNPIFALAQFFAPESDDSNDLRFVDVRSRAAAGVEPIAPWEFIDTDNGMIAHAAFPGGTTAGQGYRVHVYIPANSDMPSSMERVSLDGQLLTRTIFEEYVSRSDGDHLSMLLPTIVRMEGFNPATGKLAAIMRMKINELSIAPAALVRADFGAGAVTSKFIYRDESREIWRHDVERHSK